MIESLPLKQPWFLLEKLYQYPPICLEPPLAAMVRHLSDWGMKNISHACMEYENGKTQMWFPVEAWDSTADVILKRIAADPSLMDSAHRISDEEVIPRLRDLSLQIIQDNLQAKTNEELISLYKEFLPLQAKLQLIRCFAWLMETRGEKFSAYLLNHLKDRIKERNLDLDSVLTFSTLATPTRGTLATEEHTALLRLAERVKGKKIELSSIHPDIQAHVKKYGYLPFGCCGPAWTGEDIVKHIKECVESIDNLEQEIHSEEKRWEEIKDDQTHLLNQLNLDTRHTHLLQVAQDIVFQKAWSKEHQFLGWYAQDIFLREVARRLFISVQQVRYLLPHEIAPALRANACNVDELNQRIAYSLLIVTNAGSQILTGTEARNLRATMQVEQEPEVDLAVQSFQGQTAVPGFATGMVKIVNTIEDMAKMERGDILVSEMTIPEIVAAMKRAAAIVTDMGGITCHAAIVSREMGTPCVIATRVATKVLKDGDRVEVDAGKGIVRKI